jgi:hypothetical protein
MVVDIVKIAGQKYESFFKKDRCTPRIHPFNLHLELVGIFFASLRSAKEIYVCVLK